MKLAACFLTLLPGFAVAASWTSPGFPAFSVWVTDGNGKSFWYESWVRQGWQPGSSNYRGKEIYDPASGAWYWLDNVQQGAKATSKEVYQDSNGGKWVRYDANGHMIKGWYTQDGKTWYYDLTTGAMYKGWHTIEGSTYHFDETTGVKG